MELGGLRGAEVIVRGQHQRAESIHITPETHRLDIVHVGGGFPKERLAQARVGGTLQRADARDVGGACLIKIHFVNPDPIAAGVGVVCGQATLHHEDPPGIIHRQDLGHRVEKAKD